MAPLLLTCGLLHAIVFTFVAADADDACAESGAACGHSLLMTKHAVAQTGYKLSEEPSTLIEEAASAIAALIGDRDALAAKFLRLGFHDCVGGCDGCVDLSNPDNKGLEEPISALEDVVASATSGGVLSRADIWALATMVAVQHSVPRKSGLAFSFDHYGRLDCEASAECASGACGADPSRGGPDRELPGPNLATQAILDYFDDNFGFNATQTAALMGAHSIGKTHLENSGFGVDEEGRQSIGWVFKNSKLATGFYDKLVGPADDLEFAPHWFQRKVDNSALRAGGEFPPDRFQWEHQKSGDDRVLIMLNTDIAMVRDFSEYLDETTGEVTCGFRNRRGGKGGNRRQRGGRNAFDDVCPSAPTLQIMARFKVEEGYFYQQFEAVMKELLTHGYARDASCSDAYCKLISNKV